MQRRGSRLSRQKLSGPFGGEAISRVSAVQRSARSARSSGWGGRSGTRRIHSSRGDVGPAGPWAAEGLGRVLRSPGGVPDGGGAVRAAGGRISGSHLGVAACACRGGAGIGSDGARHRTSRRAVRCAPRRPQPFRSTSSSSACAGTGCSCTLRAGTKTRARSRGYSDGLACHANGEGKCLVRRRQACRGPDAAEPAPSGGIRGTLRHSPRLRARSGSPLGSGTRSTSNEVGEGRAIAAHLRRCSAAIRTEARTPRGQRRTFSARRPGCSGIRRCTERRMPTSGPPSGRTAGSRDARTQTISLSGWRC